VLSIIQRSSVPKKYLQWSHTKDGLRVIAQSNTGSSSNCFLFAESPNYSLTEIKTEMD